MATSWFLYITVLVLCVKLYCARTVSSILKIDGGNGVGLWGKTDFCPEGMYAAGFEQKIQPLSLSDNTALNGIKLICRNLTTFSSCSEKTVTSSVGRHGDWNGQMFCPEGSFLISFVLQMYNDRTHIQDEMGAQFISFNCRDSENNDKVRELERYPIFWKIRPVYRKSATCPLGSYICGIKTRVQYRYIAVDDNTGLNDVIMFCCS